MEWTTSLQALKGVGEKTAARFETLGIASIQDLLFYFPRDYMEYTPPSAIVDVTDEEAFVTIAGHVKSRPAVRQGNRMKITTVTVCDDSGAMQCLWFQMPYLASVLRAGGYYIFRGKPQARGKSMYLLQPQMFSPAEYEKKLQTLQPMYALTKGITNQMIAKLLRQVFEQKLMIPETLPESVCQQFQLMPLGEALWNIHFPQQYEMLKKGRRRLVFEEFFCFFLAMEAQKQQRLQTDQGVILRPDADVERMLQGLPFTLTEDQLRAWEDMKRDFVGGGCMHRMLQGDVGSGKTILAVLGCFTAAACGYQSALMAPTEVLAVQHFETISRLIEEFALPYRVGLLTGSLKASQKRRMQEQIALGLVDIVVGTHAIFQEKVEYARLAFVVTDEQHRFGVRQRAALAAKGGYPHVLVMSATPIPRTLALLLYGDLDLSLIRQMPANRIPIKNCVIPQDKRHTAYRFIEKEIQAGRQVYVICPMVEESEMLEGENVLDYSRKLKEELKKEIRIQALHGRMLPEQKNQIMEQFAAGNIDLLVSTTVIEVGIDVPNATVIMIENAERFGLSQLHQLRGRVGRGKYASYCIFVNGSKKKDNKQRLDILERSNDGFEIAEKDLELRGPGDLLGIRQSGAMQFRIGDILTDSHILYEAKEAVEQVLSDDPWLERKENYCLLEFLRSMEESWN